MVYRLLDNFLAPLVSRPILVGIVHLIILHSLPIKESHLWLPNQALHLFLLV